MPTGTKEKTIFGSPDQSECFCCPPESPSKRCSSAQTDDDSNSMMQSVGDRGGCRTIWRLSSAAPSEPIESGDDEDILGLISSSLDCFNAQLHHSPQTDMPISLSSHYGTRASPQSNDLDNSVIPVWASFAATTAGSNLQQQSRQGQGVPGSLVCPAISVASSTYPVGSLCSSACASSSMPSPPGLPRLYQNHNQPTSNLTKQSSLSQTFSDSDETSSLTGSHWKVLPSVTGVLSADSGIDGEIPQTPYLVVPTNSSSSNSTGDCTHFKSTAGFSSAEVASSPSISACRAFDFSNPALYKSYINQAARSEATASFVASDNAKEGQSDLGNATKLRPLLWPPSWPSTADCSPSIETSQLSFCPGENHQQQLVLTSQFEFALHQQKHHQKHHNQQQQQQQQTRRVCNRRKAESICFSSTARLSPINVLKSHSQNANVGQLGSLVPPSMAIDPWQPTSMPCASTQQKFAKKLQPQRTAGAFTKSCNSVLGAQRVVNLQGEGSCRSKRAETTSSSSSSSSSTSFSETSLDKPLIAKWRRACSFYLRGHCKKEDCEFAHDLTKVTCKFWEVGECFKGLTCPFLHGYPPELLMEVQQLHHEEQHHLHQQKPEPLAGK